jgi:hypothetical protein
MNGKAFCCFVFLSTSLPFCSELCVNPTNTSVVLECYNSGGLEQVGRKLVERSALSVQNCANNQYNLFCPEARNDQKLSFRDSVADFFDKNVDYSKCFSILNYIKDGTPLAHNLTSVCVPAVVNVSIAGIRRAITFNRAGKSLAGEQAIQDLGEKIANLTDDGTGKSLADLTNSGTVRDAISVLVSIFSQDKVERIFTDIVEGVDTTPERRAEIRASLQERANAVAVRPSESDIKLGKSIEGVADAVKEGGEFVTHFFARNLQDGNCIKNIFSVLLEVLQDNLLDANHEFKGSDKTGECDDNMPIGS